MPIEVNVTNQEIEVSTSGQTVNATVGGGVGPAGPQGPAGSNGATGVVSATAPISYDAENQAVGWTSFSNGTSLNVGTFDTEISGYGGISLFCAVGYELNWQAGYLRAVNGDGSTRNIWVESPLEFPGEGTDNVQIDAAGITFADGSQQTVAGAPASDFDQGLKTTDSPTFVGIAIGSQTADFVAFGSGSGEFQIAGFGRHIGIETGYIGGDWYFSTGASWDFSGCTVTGLSYNSLEDLPALFDGAYSSLTGTPTLGTAAAANTGDFAAASHSHAASAITSGTLDAARLPLATTGAAGAIIVGSGLSVASGTLSVTTYAVRSDTVSSTAYTGRAVSGSATSASVWRIRKTVYTSAGAVSATTTATNVKWDDRLTASYS